MKIEKHNPLINLKHKRQDIQFTSLSGELPKELKKFEAEFSSFANDFMQNNPGYDAYMSTKNSRNNIKKFQIKGRLGLIGKSITKKAISEIKSLHDLKNMLLLNHSDTQSIYEVIEELGRYFKPFNFINKL